jgi:hypothetical protein
MINPMEGKRILTSMEEFFSLFVTRYFCGLSEVRKILLLQQLSAALAVQEISLHHYN